MKKIVAIIAIAGLALVVSGLANAGLVQHAISVNLGKGGGSTDILAAESAGFVPKTNWNNIPGNNGVYGGTIVRSDGAATGLGWEQGGTDDHTWADPNVSGLTTPDARLLEGGGPVSTTWSWTWDTYWYGSYSQYRLTDVLAALGNPASYEVHIYQGTPSTYPASSRLSNTLIGNSGWGNVDPAFTWSGTGREDDQVTWNGAWDGGNHYVITGVTEDDPIITFRHNVWPFPEKQDNDWKPMQIEGIQIIGAPVEDEPPVPEPAGLGLIGLALLAVRKRRS